VQHVFLGYSSISSLDLSVA
jgi:hypothetical protein